MSDKSQFNIWCRAFPMLTAVLNVNGAAFSSTWALKSALYNMSHLLNHTTTFSTLKRLKHTHTHKKPNPKTKQKTHWKQGGTGLYEKAASMSTKTNKLSKKISTNGLATQQQQCNMELEFVYTHIQQRVWAGSPKCSPLRGPPYPKMLCILVKTSLEQKWRTVEVKWSRNKLATCKICTSAQPYLFYLVCMCLFLFFILSLFYYVFYSIV